MYIYKNNYVTIPIDAVTKVLYFQPYHTYVCIFACYVRRYIYHRLFHVFISRNEDFQVVEVQMGLVVIGHGRNLVR